MAVIRAIASAIGPEQLDNSSRAEALATNIEFLDSKIGTRSVARLGEGQSALDLSAKACEKLLDKQPDAHDDIGALVVCTQNPDGGGIPHLSARMHAALKLPAECSCFDISLGCSGYVHSLAILSAFMDAQGISRALLVTCDPYSRIIDPDDRNTVLLFGDAATVTLLEHSGQAGDFQPSAFSFRTISNQGDAISNPDQTLTMNGRAVFDFAVRSVPPEVRKVLKEAGVDKAEVDQFLFHQGSRFIVEQLARAIGLPTEKAPVLLKDIGNTVSSSIPLMLESTLDEKGIRQVVLCGFGVGLSVATCMLKRKIES